MSIHRIKSTLGLFAGLASAQALLPIGILTEQARGFALDTVQI
jgi:hypothetical protein